VKLFFHAAILFVFTNNIFLFSESISTVRTNAKSELELAIQKLADIRNLIEKEKVPLSKNVSKLEDRAKKLRSELQHNLRLRDNRETSLIQLETEVKETESELDYSLNLLTKYISNWSESTPPAEQTLWNQKLSALLAKDQKISNSADAFSMYFSAMLLAMDSIKISAGGIAFDGNAIVPPEGTREDGTFWSVGPFVVFSGLEGSSGFLEKEPLNETNQNFDLSLNSDLKSSPARLILSSSETTNLIKNAFQQQPQGKEIITLPLDPTLGKALIMEKGEVDIFEELKKGGIWIYPILFFAILSLFIAAFKAIQIARVKLPPSAARLDGEYIGPFELLRKTALAYKGSNPEILEEILYESIIDMQVKLEKALPLIAVTAATAPLLGLLGTVTGMIDVFRQITNFANPENSELARGISEALVTTKFGLITAIPSLIVHALLTRRLQGIVSKMEGFSARLVRLKQEKIEQNSDEPDI